MPIPSYSALPLSYTFLALRASQILGMIILLSLTSNFTNSQILANLSPSREIITALVISSLATLYTLVSLAFYWSSANLGLFVMGGIDALLALAWAIVGVVVGKPVSYVNCWKGTYEAVESGNDGVFFGEVMNRLNQGGLWAWSGLSKSNCLQTKAVWGLAIALAILYATSAALLPMLRMKHVRAGGYGCKSMA